MGVTAFCGVILAAGESSRMGRDKALLPWPLLAASEASGETFLSAAIRLLLYHVEEVLVVVGKNEAALTPVIYASGASLVINPDPDRGQFSSLRVALHEVLNLGRDAAMITLVDRPPVKTQTIETLEAAFADATARRKWAVVPEYQGKHGHPMLVGRELIEAFLRAPETSNARDVEHAHKREIEYVPVDDPLVALNINTPEEYAALRPPTLPGVQAKLVTTS
ncbi:MAG: nucleotidyltransferase family protein [Terriglobales bacterium]|jgi:molybdenum cofactor cytidylyltransferase